MKTLFSLIMLLVSVVSFSQDSLKINPEGYSSIVVSVEGKSASELYNEAINWVQTTYKNPENVLKAKIENESIRVNGFSSNAWFYKNMGMKMYYDMNYTIEVSFKDGRYKLDFTVGEFYESGKVVMHRPKHFFKKDGSVSKMYSDAVPSIEKTMNDLSMSFYNYVSGKNQEKNNDW